MQSVSAYNVLGLPISRGSGRANRDSHASLVPTTRRGYRARVRAGHRAEHGRKSAAVTRLESVPRAATSQRTATGEGNNQASRLSRSVGTLPPRRRRCILLPLGGGGGLSCGVDRGLRIIADARPHLGDLGSAQIAVARRACACQSSHPSREGKLRAVLRLVAPTASPGQHGAATADDKWRNRSEPRLRVPAP